MSKKKKTVKKVKSRWHLVTLQGLDCAPGKVQAACVVSITAMIRALKLHGAATAAGDDGAIAVWKDWYGQWRMKFMRRLATIDKDHSRYKTDVLRWLKKWWPKMRR